ncbi:MAG: hypothetical protein OXC46_04260 [Thaumarchaeota archaeon]|nr:hypothetical protein [Nitrososphaerota archaeon]
MVKAYSITQDEYEALKIKLAEAEAEFFRKITMDYYDVKDLASDYAPVCILKAQLEDAETFGKAMWVDSD